MTKRPKKITIKNRLDAVIENIPEEDRNARVQAAIQGLGGSLHVTEFEPCPVCSGNWLPTEFSHGNRRCRNCCHYESQRATPEENAASLADSRAWWAQKTRGKAVA